jgi:HK97 family phage major capsid protein
MKAELKKLYDQKGKTWAQMQDVARKLKEGSTLTKEEETQFDAWDGELKSITANIGRIERADQLELELNASKLEGKGQPGNGSTPEEISQAREKEKNLTYRKGIVRGFDALDEGEKKLFKSMETETRAFEKFLRGEELNDLETKALAGLRNAARGFNNQRAQSTTNTAGGYSIPQGFIAEIDQQLKYISPFFEEMGGIGVANAAKNIFGFINTETGNDLPFPTNNDTGNVGELLGENTDAFATGVDAVLAQVIYKAYKYSSKPMKVSNELLNDTGVDLAGFLAEILATRIGRIANTHLTTGDNTAKPQGIVTGATAGKTTAASAAITFPEIIDLEHSVDASYRKSPSCRFMLHDLVLAYLKKLTIGSAANDSRPLWQPGYTAGAPDTIDGFKYLVNNDMASTLVTTNITMLFGDMSKYGVRQVRNMVFRRLDERFADADQTAWVLFMRLDGRYKNTAAIKKLTQV